MCVIDRRGACASRASSTDGRWCPEFHPTRTEFQSFATYVRTVVEPQCARIGICKVIPPRGWFSRSYDVAELKCQTMRPAEFKTMTEAATDREPNDAEDPLEVERRFWKGLRGTMDPPVYGADIVDSLFGDVDALSWNLNDLNTILRKIDLPGEDMDLYSINYLHTGKPKFWYGVPPDSGPQLERAAQSMFPEKHHQCHQFLRHKTSLISPARLKEFGVPFYRAYQKPGEFVITFPSTYHQGFNLGYNIAEAVNFAMLHWIPYGLKAKVCKCLPDSVRIDMDSFLTQLFQEPQCSTELLGEDPWIFSCKCNKYCSSSTHQAVVEEQWFECSKCKIWAHIRCIHPALADVAANDLPQSLLCHRCLDEEAGGTSPAPPTAGVGRRSGTASKTTMRGSLRKRGKEAKVSSKQKPARALASVAMLSPPRKNKVTSKGSRGVSQAGAFTPTKGSAHKYLTVKGSTIRFEDTEAKVVAIQGKFIRVHYKGDSVDNDEWLSVTSRELRRRIIAVEPPVPSRKA
ncbi:unnamed protein product [Hyaloperonospora brassicae]|uniref:JmjC domain-containing protein n=1 Tax=Hyaloperonospora brassicae TaxID=162125 RepID=A0AAV0UQM1_HYABA|nr:unnamed protein product [Hyaloperonospora brassicae]